MYINYMLKSSFRYPNTFEDNILPYYSMPIYSHMQMDVFHVK